MLSWSSRGSVSFAVAMALVLPVTYALASTGDQQLPDEAGLGIWAGQAYRDNTPFCDIQAARRNNTTCPPSTRVYLPDTYVFFPSVIGFGNAPALIAQGGIKFLLQVTNIDPRAINHTFTIASPDGSPAFTLWLNRTGPGNVTGYVHILIGNNTVRVNGGPPLRVVLPTGNESFGPCPSPFHCQVINFYCLYHRNMGMVGRFILSPWHTEAPMYGLSGAVSVLGLLGVPVVASVLIAAHIMRKRRGKGDGRGPGG